MSKAAQPTLTEVDACVASRTSDACFPPAVEHLFQRHRRSYRARAMRAGTWPSIFAYNAFLPADCYLLPQTSGIAIALHVAVTAWIVLADLLLRREPARLVREIVSVSIPTAMAGQILTIFALNSGEAAGDYHYLVIMIVVFMNVNVRPDFRSALCGSAALGAAYVALLLSAEVPVSGQIVGSASMAAGIYLSLTANWRMERDARHGFLRRLQDQLRRAEAEAEAHRDALTGLFNRRHLDERMADLWSGADGASAMAVILLDVDHFKAFNDRYGHLSGDLCLKRVAAAIGSELSDREAVAARFGGEEFLVLLPGTDLSEAVRIGERIRRAVEGLAIPHEAALGCGRVTVSLGIMAGPVTGYPASELIAAADTALYAAKRNGRNQVWPPFVAKAAGVAQIGRAQVPSTAMQA